MESKKNQYKFYLFSIIMLLLQFSTIQGQEASVLWPLQKISGENQYVKPSGFITAKDMIPVGTYSSGWSNCFYYYGPKISELNPNVYLQFELAPKTGYDLHLDTLSIIMFSAISDGVLASIRFSTSSDFSTYTTIGSDLLLKQEEQNFSFNDLSITIPEGETGYIRTYAYNITKDNFSIRTSNLQLTGYTTLTSPPASIGYEKNSWCPDEETAEVTITGETGGIFSSTPGLILNAQTGSINLAASSPGTYTVTYTIPETESAPEFSTTAEITVNASPVCSISGSTIVFPSDIETFSAPDDLEGYNWSITGNGTIIGSTTGQTVTVEAWSEYDNSYILNLTVEDNGCTSSCSKEITINQPVVLPTATLTGTQSVCAGNSAQLIINLTGQAPWTFTWTDGVNEYTVSETYDPQHTITVHPTKNTTYSLTGQVTDGNGTTNTATGEAKIYFGPVTTIPKISACPNTSIKVPITVKSFSEVRDISLSLKYDPGVMTYRGFENGEIVFNSDEIVDVSFGDSRLIRISKISGNNLPVLEDDAALLWLKFEFIGGDTELEWIDTPDDSWCSYSYLSELDETGFETEDFCDLPAESYYINGSVRQLSVSGTDVSPIADIKTITGTPVIIPVSVTYPDLEAQQVTSEVVTDARISYNGTGAFPSGARVSKVNYNGNSVLSSPFEIGGKSEVLLSEMLGTAAKPLLNHSGLDVDWEFYIDGISSPANVPVKVEALAYTNLNECVIVLDTEPFNVSFNEATLSVTESVTVCGTESLEFTTEIEYPEISNLHSSIKADAKIKAALAFPEGTIIDWNYNSSANGSYTLPASTAEIMLSEIVGTLPNSLQGHSGTDVWNFSISNAGLMDGNEITIEAVALLDDENYIYSVNGSILTVNPIPEITAVSLLTSTDENNWTNVTGGLSTGYEMCADPAVDFHYFDIDELNSSVEPGSDFELNAFYLDVNNLPADFYEYWNDQGVNGSALNNWQAVMWDIINGEKPMFYISYDGTDYKLIDGLEYQNGNYPERLRISGDYPAGDYIFNGSVTDVNGCVSEVFDVTLNLSSAPVIVCPDNIEVNNETGECGAGVSFAAIATGSPAPEIIYTLSDDTQIASGYFFPVGTTTVTATAGNDCKTVSCTFDVTVVDAEAPDISCPVSGNMDVIMNNACTYVRSGITWDATATDNCSVDNLHYTLSGATTGTGISLENIAFNFGTTKVTWKVTDTSGNTNEYSYTVTVSGVNLTGTIRYYNNAETLLDNTTVSLLEPESGAVVATSSTNAKGEYLFANVCPGIYNVNIITDNPVRSINSTDAGQVNAWNILQSGDVWPSIEKVRFLAGDVNGDKYANAGDAGIIQNYFLTLGTGVSFSKPWVFWKTNHPVTTQPQPDNEIQLEIPAESSELIQDFYGLVNGDFNRSNDPSIININSLVTKSARSDMGSVTLLKGKDLIVAANEMAELPIRALSSMQVGAISLILDFPANQLQIVDVILKDNNDLAAGFNVIDNMLIIGWNSVNPISVEAGDPILTVKLKMIDGNEETPVHFRMAENPLNELADENMNAIDNAPLIIDGLKMKGNVTGINISDRQASMLMTCYPNPFNDHATIKYILPEDGNVNLDVIGMLGNRIKILSNQQQSAGEYLIDLNGTNLVPGVYQIALRFTDQKGQSLMTTVRVVKQ